MTRRPVSALPRRHGAPVEGIPSLHLARRSVVDGVERGNRRPYRRVHRGPDKVEKVVRTDNGYAVVRLICFSSPAYAGKRFPNQLVPLAGQVVRKVVRTCPETYPADNTPPLGGSLSGCPVSDCPTGAERVTGCYAETRRGERSTLAARRMNASVLFFEHMTLGAWFVVGLERF